MKSSMRSILLCGTLLALFTSGCGYNQGGGGDKGNDKGGGYNWSSLYRSDVRTIAVPIFTTRSFDRGTEFNLSEAVVKQIEATTPYKVVPRERADTILEGQVVDVSVSTLSTDPNSAIPQEQLLGLTIDFTWKDLRTGRILVERRGFEQTATYYPTLGEGRFTGRQGAIEKLALAIVQELQADW
jgi:lipopolysaccharide assembly LptE-like protein